jgi:peptidoglycan/LPS O-acetylase OafA/YrhL
MTGSIPSTPTAISTAAAPARIAQPRHIPALDGVRGLAILGVLLVHSKWPFVLLLGPTGHAVSRLMEGGAYGVDLFFVLSGFLITGILLDSRDSPAYFRSFYARRILRLFPVYYLYLAVAAFALPAAHRLAGTAAPPAPGSWWWYLLYLSNWSPGGGAGDAHLGHFWSLAVEEQFYLFWSVLIYFMPGRRKLAVFCVSLAAGALLLRCGFAFSGAAWNTTYRLTPMRLDCMALGGLMAILHRSEGGWAVRIRRAAPAAFVLFAAAFVAVSVFAGGMEWERIPVQTVGATFLASCFAALVCHSARLSGGPLFRFLNRPWLRSFGKYSYAMYVIHVAIFSYAATLVLYASRRMPLPAAMALFWAYPALMIVLAYAGAWMSWRILEGPVLRLKSRFPY